MRTDTALETAMNATACTAITGRHVFRYGLQDFEFALDARGEVELRQLPPTLRASSTAIEPTDLIAVGRGEFATPTAIVEAALDTLSLSRTGRFLAERYLAAGAGMDLSLAA